MRAPAPTPDPTPEPDPNVTPLLAVDFSRHAPSSPAPRATIFGPDLPVIPGTDWQGERLGRSYDQTDPLDAALSQNARTVIRDRLASVGILSMGAWTTLTRRTAGRVGQELRKQARTAVESSLRLAVVTSWLASEQRRSWHDDRAERIGHSGRTHKNGVRSGAIGPLSDIRASRAEAVEARSLAHWTDPFTVGPHGLPMGSVRVQSPDGTVKWAIPEPPDDAAPSPPARKPSRKPSRKPDVTAADRMRRRRARARAARMVTQAAQHDDLAALAIASRSAARTVAMAASSHPWDRE